MLTGQNYPDIVLMDRGNDIVNRYIEAGALLPLNDLIDEYGPDVKEMYGETLNKSRYTDGKNYYLNNWYGEDPDPVAGVLMRYDYLCEIVGKDRADSDEPFTQEEYIDICKKFKELHPTIDGKEKLRWNIKRNVWSENILSGWGQSGTCCQSTKLQRDDVLCQ